MADLDGRKRFFFGMEHYRQKLRFTRLYGDSREVVIAKADRAKNFSDVFQYMGSHRKIATPHFLGQYLGCLGASTYGLSNISRWYRDYEWLKTAYHETFENMGGVTNWPPLGLDVCNVWSPAANRPGASITDKSTEFPFQLGWDRAILEATQHMWTPWRRVGWHAYYNGLDGRVAEAVFDTACNHSPIDCADAVSGYLAAQQDRLQNSE